MRGSRPHGRTFTIVLACALVSSAAIGQTVRRQETVKLPPVPARSVELDRARTAATWNSRFCSRWTDECVRCFKPVALANSAVCEPADDAAATCAPSSVRCLEFDPVIAPLFCTGLNDGCGSASVAVGERGDEFLAVSNDYCIGRKIVRPPVNWVCGTAQSVRDHCAQTEHKGYRSVRECVQVNLSTWRQYRRAMERLIRDSNRLELR